MTQRARVVAWVVALAVVAVALAVGLRVTAPPPPAGPPAAPHDGRLVNPFLPEELGADGGGPVQRVMSLTVRAQGAETKLRLGSEGWELEQPLVAPADPTRLSGMVLSLEEGHTEVLDEQPSAEALARYGLSPPRFTVDAEVKVAGQVRRVGFEGGAVNSFDDTVYLRRRGEARVLTAPAQLAHDFDVGTAALRDARILAVREVDVAAVEVLGAAGWKAERTALREWNLTRPDAGPGDHLELAHWLGELSNAKAERFVEDAGPGTTRLEVQLSMADLTTVRVRLWESDAGLLGRRDSEDFAATAVFSPVLLKELLVDPATLVDRRVVDVEPPQVVRVELRDGAARVEATRVDGGWRVGREAGAGEGVERFLARLGEARSVTVPTRWDPRLTPDGGKSVTLFGGDGGVLGEAQLGGDVPGAPGVVFVRSGARRLEVEADKLRWPAVGALR